MDAAGRQVEGAVTMMRDQCQMLQLLRTHFIGLCKIAHIDDVGFKELVHRREKIVTEMQRQDHSLVDLVEHVRNEPKRAERQIDLTENRYVLIERHERNFALDSNRV